MRVTASAVVLGVAPAAGASVPRDLIRPWAGIADAGRGMPARAADVVIVFRAAPAALRPGAIGSSDATTAARTDQARILRRLRHHGLHLTISVQLTRVINAVVAEVPG